MWEREYSEGSLNVYHYVLNMTMTWCMNVCMYRMSKNSQKILILHHLWDKVLPTGKKSMTVDSSGLLTMECYMKEQLIFIVEQYFKNNEDFATTVCSFCTKYSWNSDLTSATAKRLIKKFGETGSISHLKYLLAILQQVIQHKTWK